jgi:small subunit ribosomal protein S20
LANIKSQIKRNRQNEKRRVRNRTFRGAARTAVNQARTALEGNVPETQEAVMLAISMLDKAAAMGVVHANNASRRKGRLMKRLAALGIQPTAKKIEEPETAVEEAAEPKKKAPAKKAAAPKKEAAPKKAAAEKKPAAKKTAAKK